ncbi:hypothetical protein C3747_53g239 [Trypanosoma cruzi]|uniref:MYCBP-associated protein n=2 Tax=Trypanosoma cruzi TaxID=5693 RepID=Q4DYL9_TRYCC|nr:hypothetical protein, conserved [Trypanosoma cruzi]EAN97643.1 hypothetical protein, conserved [Trypanosoma cruzi]PWV12166.1 hypothetical protein C3747_53g239 [Trypanosoma cruzi]|eukprot:XP_819494.1 hypothetical protein [Trypanosoma cruzi strain CL Brener]
MSQFARVPAGDSQRNTVTSDLYDQRDLQEKALETWEKQKRIWAAVQEKIRRRVGNNGQIRGACMNMSQGAYRARVREEEVAVVNNATPSHVFSGYYTWESTLRTTEDNGAIRYVKAGQTNFPYALYGKLTDKRRLDVEHLTNTRVVFPEEQILNEATSRELQRPSTGAFPVSFRDSSYYKERFKQYYPLIERNMPHLLLPRAYLEVCGQPPPWTSKPEDKVAAARKSLPAVAHVPPPSPKGKQQQVLQKEQNGQEKSCSHGVEETDSKGESKDVNFTVSTEETVAGAPSLEISTSRVLFFARPGELAHGTVKIHNNGTTTVYYSWAPFQPATALDGKIGNEKVDSEVEKKEEEEEKKGRDETIYEEKAGFFSLESSKEKEEVPVSATSGENDIYTKGTPQSSVWSNQKGERKPHQLNVSLRSLAKKSAQSKSFFFLSAQLDGVILPDEEKTFSFSVRAAFPGCFLRYYELLMVPAASSRVILELRAFIQDGGPSVETISRPVAAALEAKAVADTQRELINALAAHPHVYEAAEIAKATQDCLDAAKAAKEAQDALIARWRKLWHDSTYTAMRIPFNIAVYGRLTALHQNLARTMSALESPLHHEEWDGSVQTIQGDLCMLHDAVSRNTLREGFNILLRAAIVSEQEDEPLDLLLQRVAGMVAFSALARQTGELDDSILLILGVRDPRVPQNGLRFPTGVLGSGSGGITGAAAAAGGGRKVAGGGGGNAAAIGGGGGGKSQGKASNKGKRSASIESNIGRFGSTDKSPALNDMNMTTDSVTEVSVKEEYSARLFSGMRRLVGDAVDQFCSNLDCFRCTIEATCALPLLETTAFLRAEDTRTIQNAVDMEVDFTVDIAPPKKKR